MDRDEVEKLIESKLNNVTVHKLGGTPTTAFDLVNKHYLGTITETATINITGASVSGTANVTSGGTILGSYISNFTGVPASSASWLFQTTISSNQVAITLGASPGGGVTLTFTVVLLKPQ